MIVFGVISIPASWFATTYALELREMIRFQKNVPEDEKEIVVKEDKQKILVVDDYNPRHLRERILSCREWIRNGDSLENVYYYYDILEQVVWAMDNIQTFVNIPTKDSAELFQLKLRTKLNEWFGEIDFPVHPDTERHKYVCASEKE